MLLARPAVFFTLREQEWVKAKYNLKLYFEKERSSEMSRSRRKKSHTDALVSAVFLFAS